jgi:hypothetical protein
MEVFEDVVLVAVVMGGESTHPETSIKTKSPNSSGPQAEVQAYRGWWTVARSFYNCFQRSANVRSLRAKRPISRRPAAEDVAFLSLSR